MSGPLNSREITVEVTNRCGARCLTCPRESFTEKLGHMDMELFRRIMNDAAAEGYNSLDTCGFGDPLLDPLLQERLAFIKSRHPQISIYSSTTCHELTEERLPWFASHVDTLKISFFGMTPGSYEAVHRGLRHAKSLENITRLAEYRARHGRPHLIGLFLLQPQNEHEAKDFIKHFEPLLDEVMVWKPHNWVAGRGFRSPSAQRKSCGRPQNGNLTVGVDGRVSICCFDYNKTTIIGDLRTQTIAQVRQSSPMLDRICEVHRTGTFQNSGLLCEDCDQTFAGQEDVLVYASNAGRKVGRVTSHEHTPIDLTQGVDT